MDMTRSKETESQHLMDELISKIEHAFADVEYPGDDNLTNSRYGVEPAALVDEFRGKRDRDQLDVTFLNLAPDGFGTALSFFSDDALRFYLPVYLIADIRGELDFPDPVPRLCWSLTPKRASQKIAKQWGGGTVGDRDRATFAKLNAAQVSAVLAYLWWRLEAAGGHDEVIEQAIENYWLERDSNSADSA
jgi:Family of unknown function (DUF6714)